MTTLGAFVQKCREEKELSQQQVAKVLGLTRSGYASMEVGRVPIALEHLHQLSLVLEVPIAVFAALYAFPDKPTRRSHDWAAAHGLKASQLSLLAKLVYMDDDVAENTVKIMTLLLGRDHSWRSKLRKASSR